MKFPKKIYAKAEKQYGEEVLRFSTSPFLMGNEVYVNLKQLLAWILNNGDEYGGDPCLGIDCDAMVEDIERYFNVNDRELNVNLT